MACACKKNVVIDKRPDTPCLFCAHKHAAAARALYDLEPGYRSINRSDAIGQLILAAWHLQAEHYTLAMKARDCWLRIERLEDTADMLRELQSELWNLINQERN